MVTLQYHAVYSEGHLEERSHLAFGGEATLLRDDKLFCRFWEIFELHLATREVSVAILHSFDRRLVTLYI